MRALPAPIRRRRRLSDLGGTSAGVWGGVDPGRTSTERHRITSRRGAVMVLVMVCLLGVSMLAATLLRLAVAQQRQLRMEGRRLQAEWLAEAALERAAAMLRRDPAWSGDEWTLSADVLPEGGTVVTRVEPAAAAEGGWQVAAAASVPAGDPWRARVTRRAILHDRAEGTQEDRP